MRQRNKMHLLGSALGVSVALLVAGCEDYLERRDTVTLGVGDSIAVNKATQTINRWPNAAREDRWLSDGERARIAEARYRRREVPNPKTLEKSGDSGSDTEAAVKGGATTGK